MTDSSNLGMGETEAKRLRDITTAPAYVTGVDRGAAAKRSREVEKAIAQQAANAAPAGPAPRAARKPRRKRAPAQGDPGPQPAG